MESRRSRWIVSACTPSRAPEMRSARAAWAQLRTGPLPVLLILSLLGFIALGVIPGAAAAAVCGSLRLADLWSLGGPALTGVSPASVALDWGVMVVAMMSVVITPQVAHVLRLSPPRARGAAAASVYLGFLSVWLLAGALLLPLGMLHVQTAPGGLAPLLAVGFALVWSASPPAQAARNRCHRLGRVGGFGPRARWDNARIGIRTGLWCVAACWPVMLIPLTIGGAAHVPAMAIAALYLLLERIGPPAPVRWSLPPVISLVRQALLPVARVRRTSRAI